MSSISNVLVVGAGLMGASVGLAAREAGMDVRILDIDDQRASEASRNTGLEVFNSNFVPDLICVATPPEQTAFEVLKAIRMFPQSTVIDIASIKTQSSCLGFASVLEQTVLYAHERGHHQKEHSF